LLIALIWCPSAPAQDCEDSVVIDSVTYPVPSRWCGRDIDTSQIAEPSNLVKLPQNLTFEDRNIYVLPQVREALILMSVDAERKGAKIVVASGFRSVGYQARIIKRRLDKGQDIETIFRYVAPPGYSEHHTGRALDLSPGGVRFAETETYRWLRENAEKYGFVESIPNDSASGEDWEPWHWYYNGDL
jgi:D-alanyl-D-alanine carboxypeptidase